MKDRRPKLNSKGQKGTDEGRNRNRNRKRSGQKEKNDKTGQDGARWQDKYPICQDMTRKDKIWDNLDRSKQLDRLDRKD